MYSFWHTDTQTDWLITRQHKYRQIERQRRETDRYLQGEGKRDRERAKPIVSTCQRFASDVTPEQRHQKRREQTVQSEYTRVKVA